MSGAARVMAVLLAVTMSASAAENVLWNKVYGSDGRNYNPSALAATGYAFYVAGTSAAPGLGGRQPEFWLWKIGADGELVRQTVIARAEAQERTNPSADHIRGMVANAAGGALVVEFEMGDPYFATFDDEAKITSLKRMEIPELTVITVHRLLAVADGEYLALGGADGKGFAMRVDRGGNVRWSARSAGANVFTDGAVLPDGGLVAIGSDAAQPNQFSLSFFAAGNSVPRVVPLRGKKASIAPGNDGGVVLVYDRSTEDLQDIRIANVNASGSILAERAVATYDPTMMPPYQIARTGPNRYLVAGTTQKGIAALRYEPDQVALLLETTREHRPRHWFLQRVTGDPAAALTIVYTGGAELTTKVGVIRFR